MRLVGGWFPSELVEYAASYQFLEKMWLLFLITQGSKKRTRHLEMGVLGVTPNSTLAQRSHCPEKVRITAFSGGKILLPTYLG